jgi:hypothetical protein
MFWIFKRFCYLYGICIFLSFNQSSLVLVFPLSSLRSLYKVPFYIRWIRLKNGVVLLTSYIPRIAVALFLQFVFVITNNIIKCCSRLTNTFYLFHPFSEFVTTINWVFFLFVLIRKYSFRKGSANPKDEGYLFIIYDKYATTVWHFFIVIKKTK